VPIGTALAISEANLESFGGIENSAWKSSLTCNLGDVAATLSVALTTLPALSPTSRASAREPGLVNTWASVEPEPICRPATVQR
jgi:hypothetical protein